MSGARFGARASFPKGPASRKTTPTGSSRSANTRTSRRWTSPFVKSPGRIWTLLLATEEGSTSALSKELTALLGNPKLNFVLVLLCEPRRKSRPGRERSQSGCVARQLCCLSEKQLWRRVCVAMPGSSACFQSAGGCRGQPGRGGLHRRHICPPRSPPCRIGRGATRLANSTWASLSMPRMASRFFTRRSSKIRPRSSAGFISSSRDTAWSSRSSQGSGRASASPFLKLTAS